jgi:hypothetical protein
MRFQLRVLCLLSKQGSALLPEKCLQPFLLLLFFQIESQVCCDFLLLLFWSRFRVDYKHVPPHRGPVELLEDFKKYIHSSHSCTLNDRWFFFFYSYGHTMFGSLTGVF